jgi:GNAT superfamily N-acetyltransferase
MSPSLLTRPAAPPAPAPEPSLRRRLARFFWSETVHVFHEASFARVSAPSADVRPATRDDAEAVTSAFPRVPFDRRLDAGDSAWLAFVDGRLAHQTWVSPTRAFIPQVAFDRPLDAGAIYIYDCVTLPEFRGQGLYPSALAAACEHWRARGRARAILGILDSNDASRRGASKAGFEPAFRHVYRTCCGVSWGREERTGGRE